LKIAAFKSLVIHMTFVLERIVTFMLERVVNLMLERV